MADGSLVALLDLDGTLYPGDCPLLHDLDRRITQYIAERFGIAHGEADRLRAETLVTRGTTLRGLIELHGIDPEGYVAYLDAVDARDYLRPDPELGAVLASMTARRAILTNAGCVHTDRVLDALGVDRGLFCAVYDLGWSNYVGKPAPTTYAAVASDLGVAPEAVTFIDDTPRFLRPARELGMRTVLVGANGQPPPYVDATCADLRALPSVAPWLFG